MNIKDSEIKALLQKFKKLTIYGLSPDPTKPSHSVPLFMRSQGYDIVGVYPKGDDFAGFKIYKSLAEVPLEYREFVSVFRAAPAIPNIVDEVLEAGGTKVLWLQLGISHPEAEHSAQDAGLTVVSNRCLHIEYEKYLT